MAGCGEGGFPGRLQWQRLLDGLQSVINEAAGKRHSAADRDATDRESFQW